MTVFIMFTITLLLTVYCLTTVKFNKDSQKKVLDKEVENQYNILADALIDNDFEIVGNDNLNKYADAISTFFEGRVIIIDSNYKIIKDTAKSNEGAYIVNDLVISIMTEEKSHDTFTDSGYYQYVYSVKSEDTVLGAIIICASYDKVNGVADYIAERSYLMCIIVLILGAIFALLGGYISVRGIKKINEHIDAMSGNVEEDIPERGFSELRDLTGHYNKSIKKLLELDSSRQEFVSNVSHELKTPITSMKVLADSLVQNDEADLAMYKEFMSDIVAEIDRESEIISDLLTLVKTDKKSAQINYSEVDINDLLEVILKRVAPLADARGITITYESYREVVADVDEVKLTLALTNIIENAIKYNVDNGWVKVTLNSDHKKFHVKVADSGVGIPDDCKDKVFERFYRVDKARSRDTGGTGLGLSITRNIILMHKGSIKLYSESGEGTTFTIKIPIKSVDNKEE